MLHWIALVVLAVLILAIYKIKQLLYPQPLKPVWIEGGIPNVRKDSEDVQDYETILRHGLIVDGTGTRKAWKGDIAIDSQGKIAYISPPGQKILGKAKREMDVEGMYVIPGLLDAHTHYDAEIEGHPGLEESVRHGTTTVLIGNCSLSICIAEKKEDLLDLFCRVENMPPEVVSRWLKDSLAWHSFEEYHRHLEQQLPIGPNVATMIGHSNLRAHVMGLQRSLEVDEPNEKELQEMKNLVDEAMKAGYMGLSIDMLPFHRMHGDRFMGISIPSQRASMREYAELAEVVRDHGGLFQATPNVLRIDTSLFLFGLSSAASFLSRLFTRTQKRSSKALKTTILAALDPLSNRLLHFMALTGAQISNKLFGANVRFQALPTIFNVESDGAYTPLFEEWPLGGKAMDVSNEERMALFRDKNFRTKWRQQWNASGPKLFHRKLEHMYVITAPDASLEGKSFTAIAKKEGKEPLDCFMDLIGKYGDSIRWKTTVANDRVDVLRWILSHPAAMPGFQDSGAHTRNMANHDAALHVLKLSLLNPDWMPFEQAVAKVTSECADWMGMGRSVGILAPNRNADIVVLCPDKLRRISDDVCTPIPVLEDDVSHQAGEAFRLVRRHEQTPVQAVFIGGKLAFDGEKFSPGYGEERYGRVLKRETS